MSAATVAIAPREIAGLALADHVIAMADDAYLTGHPEWNEIVNEARKLREASERAVQPNIQEMTTPDLLARIAELQQIQMTQRNSRTPTWQTASELLAPCFSEMARREPG